MRHQGQWFRRLAHATAQTAGRAQAFLVALGIVVAWGLTGPLFHFSDTWQLVINTGTTIVTFLMVFLIQNTQNRDAHAVHLKLDELIRANRTARNSLLALEEMDDEQLQQLQAEFEELRDRVVRARGSTASAGPTGDVNAFQSSARAATSGPAAARSDTRRRRRG